MSQARSLKTHKWGGESNTRKSCVGEMSACGEEPGLSGFEMTPPFPPVLCLLALGSPGFLCPQQPDVTPVSPHPTSLSPASSPNR